MKMDEKETIKLELQRLKWQSDFHKFEYGQVAIYFLSLFGVLVAVFIPTIISFRGDLSLVLATITFFLVLFLISIYLFDSFNRKVLRKIAFLSRQIDLKFKKALDD